MAMKARPPTHQAGNCDGRNPASATAVKPMPRASTVPPTNHTPTRAATCTERALESRGCEVHAFAATEIGINGGGGPTCLTRPILREA